MNLDERLSNWGAWLRVSPVYKQCGSVEGNYRSPQHWHPPGPRPKEPHALDAYEVTLAAATLAFRYHLILKLRHVVRLSDDGIGRVFRKELKERVDVQATEGMARIFLVAALDEPVVSRRQRAVAKVRQMLQREEESCLP